MEVWVISQTVNILNDWDFTYLLGIVMGIVPSLLCITLHELSHGFAAYLLGDDTAKRAGRLSLNPLRHLDFMGLLMMLTFRVGWAKPVPVNMYRFKKPRQGMAITALAGPVSNIIICLIFLLLYGALYIPLSGSGLGRYIRDMIELTAYMSLGLAVFNLLPVPPLDGSKVLFSFIGDRRYSVLMRYERYGGLALFLLAATGVLGKPLSLVISYVYSLFIPVAQWACDKIYLLFY